MNKRIVFEISQLAKWPGMLTGIPRTMDELARRFNAEGAVFVDWDSNSRCFFETSYDDAMTKRQLVSSSLTKPQAHVSDIKKVVRKLKARSRLVTKGVDVAKGIAARHGSEQSVATPFEFTDTDKLVITWGETIDLEYTQAVVRAQEHGAEIVQFVHDMIPIVTPQFAGHTTEALKRYASYVLPIASHIVTNSKHTQEDTVQWLKENNLSSHHVSVMRLGDDFEFAEARKVSDSRFIKSGLKGDDFLLTVGTVEARKNHTLYYYLYKLARQRDVELPKLVIVGRRGWKTENIYDFMTEDPEVKDMFIFLHDIDDEALSWLYSKSLFTLYASFYEGWGLPIAESIGRGVPCIASSTSSMPEVANGLAYRYPSPYSADEWLAATVALLDGDTLDNERKKVTQYQQVTWDSSYTQLKSIIGLE